MFYFVLQIQDKDVVRLMKFNYLGDMFEDQLHWKEHVDSICNKVNNSLGGLWHIDTICNNKVNKSLG